MVLALAGNKQILNCQWNYLWNKVFSCSLSFDSLKLSHNQTANAVTFSSISSLSLHIQPTPQKHFNTNDSSSSSRTLTCHSKATLHITGEREKKTLTNILHNYLVSMQLRGQSWFSLNLKCIFQRVYFSSKCVHK